MRIFAALTCLFVLAACNDAGDSSNVIEGRACAITDFGSGVYYMNCTRANFGNGLSTFLEENPELSVIAVTGDGTGYNGINDGYFVVTEPRQ